jgi:hypothetical protein
MKSIFGSNLMLRQATKRKEWCILNLQRQLESGTYIEQLQNRVWNRNER